MFSIFFGRDVLIVFGLRALRVLPPCVANHILSTIYYLLSSSSLIQIYCPVRNDPLLHSRKIILFSHGLFRLLPFSKRFLLLLSPFKISDTMKFGV